MVITGRTRNAVVRKGSWVRIPPPPPYNGMWLSLVEHYVRDVGAAGSNPVIPTKNIEPHKVGFFIFAFELKGFEPQGGTSV